MAYTPIDPNQCIGDSLAIINATFSNLDTAVTNAVDGTGTANYIPKWSDSNTLTSSNVIASTSPSSHALKVNVHGDNAKTLFQMGSGGYTCNTTVLFPNPTQNAGYAGDADEFADYHYMSMGFTEIAITSLSSSGGGDAVLVLRNAPADNSSSTAHRWAIHNDRSENNNLDFRYDNSTKVSITTGGRIEAGKDTNLAIGIDALKSANLNDIEHTVAIGYKALEKCTVSHNTAVGHIALQECTTGDQNTAFGDYALSNNQTGGKNVAVGQYCMGAGSTGSYNTAVGNDALTWNTADYNVAIGSSALSANTTGRYNVAVGANALTKTIDATDNTAVGYGALEEMTRGDNNTVLGNQAGCFLKYGVNNVVIGENSGVGSSTLGKLLSASNCVFIGESVATRAYGATEHPINCIYIGYNVESTAAENNVVRIGNNSIDKVFISNGSGVLDASTANDVHVGMDSTTGVLTNMGASSLRYKINVENVEVDYTNSIILGARPVWYRFNPDTVNVSDPTRSAWGFIAEELAEIEPRLVSWSYLPEDYEQVKRTKDLGNGEVYPYFEKVLKEGSKKVPDGVHYDRFTVHLVKFAQEQHQEIKSLEAKVEAQAETIKSIETRLAALEAK